MPYRYLNFIKNSLIHVFNRGNNHMTLFRNLSDYKWVINRAQELEIEEKFWIPAYCLMPNHFHFYIKTKSDDEISKYFQRLQLAYAKYFNRKYYQSGHVFEGPFKSILVDDENYAIYLCKYIHLNPVKAKLVNKPEEWEFSNYGNVISQSQADFQVSLYGTYFRRLDEYADFVNDGIDEYKKVKQWLFD
ncbi:transposase [bacterium]|nr:transposase [bacterium]